MRNSTECQIENGEEMFDRVEFGKRVRKERKRKGWTQEKLIEEINRQEGGYLSDIERGKKSPSFETAIRIADKLGVSLDYLCGRDQYLKGNITTMGDIARALIALSFIKGTKIFEKTKEVKVPRRTSNCSAQEVPEFDTETRDVIIIEIGKGDFRHFLPSCRRLLGGRPHTKDLCEILERDIDKMDKKPISAEFNDKQWGKLMSYCDEQSYSREEAERILWNKVPPISK